MVLRVCRARLADPYDALDAFQATFLVRVEKSRRLWVRDSLGPWLHQVASRTASCALSAAARRRRVERTAAELAASTEAPDDRPGSGCEQALHEEINRLPERYREVIVLCDLEGDTCDEAARRIGRPVGTVK
jgi:RNA polymerase sigma factor (sigma-70 family)